jgi:lysophospholipase L1-like esterase
MNPRLAGSHLYRLAFAVRLEKATQAQAPVAIPQDSSAELVPAALADLQGLAQAHGFAVLVAGFPFLDVLPDGANRHLFEDVRGWSQQYGFRFLDLTDALVEASRGGRIHVDPLHPNERGARFVAKALAEVVRAEFLP